jgi:signal transduction histidine kinase
VLGAVGPLTPTSTLADLPSHDFEVGPTTLGQEVVAEFERRSDLPGVIVRTAKTLVGMISRPTFFQEMSRPFSREIYLKRPIQVFFHSVPPEPLCLPAACRISEAARFALDRRPALVYEPIIVEGPEGNLRVLDVYVLLLAQNRALLEAQAALVQSEKLASLGQLAAGVAHEINNPIAYVSNNLAVLRRDVLAAMGVLDRYRAGAESLSRLQPALAAEAAEMEQRIDLPYIRQNLTRQFDASLDGLRRVRQIVRNLGDFARLNEAEFKEVDINAALASTIEIVRHEFNQKAIRVETDFEEVVLVPVHTGKINRVFLNLLLNAVQACASGGRIAVRTRAEAGRGVVVDIEDDGCGISPEQMPHLFEPFFTTKPVGQGTGLGLAVCYRVIREHGGSIEVKSTPGQGSVFRVRLPFQPLPAGERVAPSL